MTPSDRSSNGSTPPLPDDDETAALDAPFDDEAPWALDDDADDDPDDDDGDDALLDDDGPAPLFPDELSVCDAPDEPAPGSIVCAVVHPNAAKSRRAHGFDCRITGLRAPAMEMVTCPYMAFKEAGADVWTRIQRCWRIRHWTACRVTPSNRAAAAKLPFDCRSAASSMARVTRRCTSAMRAL